MQLEKAAPPRHAPPLIALLIVAYSVACRSDAALQWPA